MKKRIAIALALALILMLACACGQMPAASPSKEPVEVPPATGYGPHQRIGAFLKEPFTNDDLSWGVSYDVILAEKRLEVYDEITLIDERSVEGQKYAAYRDIYFFETGGMLNRANTLFEYSDQEEYYYELQRIKQVVTDALGDPSEGTLETFDFLPPENSDVLQCIWTAGNGSRMEILLSDNTTRGSQTPYYIMIRLAAPTTV